MSDSQEFTSRQEKLHGDSLKLKKEICERCGFGKSFLFEKSQDGAQSEESGVYLCYPVMVFRMAEVEKDDPNKKFSPDEARKTREFIIKMCRKGAKVGTISFSESTCQDIAVFEAIMSVFDYPELTVHELCINLKWYMSNLPRVTKKKADILAKVIGTNNYRGEEGLALPISRLLLHGNRFRSEHVTTIVSAIRRSSNKKLRQLNLRRNDFNQKATENLGELLCKVGMEHLTLAECKNVNPHYLRVGLDNASSSGMLNSLNVLDLRRVSLDYEQLESISKALLKCNVSALNLRGCLNNSKVGSATSGLKQVVALPQLVELSLAENDIPPSGIDEIFSNMKDKMRNLDLRANNIDSSTLDTKIIPHLKKRALKHKDKIGAWVDPNSGDDMHANASGGDLDFLLVPEVKQDLLVLDLRSNSSMFSGEGASLAEVNTLRLFLYTSPSPGRGNDRFNEHDDQLQGLKGNDKGDDNENEGHHIIGAGKKDDSELPCPDGMILARIGAGPDTYFKRSKRYRLDNLTHLVLSNQKIEEFKKEWIEFICHDMPHLESLDISSNHFSELPLHMCAIPYYCPREKTTPDGKDKVFKLNISDNKRGDINSIEVFTVLHSSKVNLVGLSLGQKRQMVPLGERIFHVFVKLFKDYEAPDLKGSSKQKISSPRDEKSRVYKPEGGGDGPLISDGAVSQPLVMEPPDPATAKHNLPETPLALSASPSLQRSHSLGRGIALDEQQDASRAQEVQDSVDDKSIGDTIDYEEKVFKLLKKAILMEGEDRASARAPRFINAMDSDGRTPLHIACFYGRVRVALWLVENGALLDVLDTRGYIAAEMLRYNSLRRFNDISDECSPSQSELSDRAVENETGWKESAYGVHPLRLFRECRDCLSEYELLVNINDEVEQRTIGINESKDGKTLLKQFLGHALTALGASTEQELSVTKKNRFDPGDWGMVLQEKHRIKRWLDQLNLFRTESYLHQATLKGSPEQVALMLELSPEQIYEVDGVQWRTPLHFAALGRNSEVMNVLVNHLRVTESASSIWEITSQHAQVKSESSESMKSRTKPPQTNEEYDKVYKRKFAEELTKKSWHQTMWFKFKLGLSEMLYEATGIENDILRKRQKLRRYRSMSKSTGINTFDRYEKTALHYAIQNSSVDHVESLCEISSLDPLLPRGSEENAYNCAIMMNQDFLEMNQSILDNSPEQVQDMQKKQCQKQLSLLNSISHVKSLRSSVLLKRFLKSFLPYCIFLIILTLASPVSVGVGWVPDNSFLYNQKFAALVMEEEIGSITYPTTFYDVVTIGDVWAWLEGPFVEGLFPTQDDYGTTLSSTEQKFIYRYNRLLGSVRLRQLRVTSNSCFDRTDAFITDGRNCYSDFYVNNEDKNTFNNVAWADNGGSGMWGIKGLYYPDSGFNVDLVPGDSSAASTTVTALKNAQWIDQGTRAVFIDFSQYNPASNLVMFTRLTFEFPATGGTVPTAETNVFMPDLASNMQSGITLALEILLVFCVAGYALSEVKEVVALRKRYFRLVWNYWDLLVFCNFVAKWAVFIAIIAEWEERDFSIDDQSTFYNFYTLSTLFTANRKLSGVLLVLCWLRLVKYLVKVPKVGPVIEAVKSTLLSSKVIVFLFILFLMWWAFSLGAYFALGTDLEGYRNMAQSMLSILRMILGDFDADELQGASPFFGTGLYVIIVVLGTLVLLNLLIAVLTEEYISQWEKNEDKWEDVINHIMESELGGRFPTNLQSRSWQRAVAFLGAACPCSCCGRRRTSRVNPTNDVEAPEGPDILDADNNGIDDRIYLVETVDQMEPIPLMDKELRVLIEQIENEEFRETAKSQSKTSGKMSWKKHRKASVLFHSLNNQRKNVAGRVKAVSAVLRLKNRKQKREEEKNERQETQAAIVFDLIDPGRLSIQDAVWWSRVRFDLEKNRTTTLGVVKNQHAITNSLDGISKESRHESKHPQTKQVSWEEPKAPSTTRDSKSVAPFHRSKSIVAISEEKQQSKTRESKSWADSIDKIRAIVPQEILDLMGVLDKIDDSTVQALRQYIFDTVDNKVKDMVKEMSAVVKNNSFTPKEDKNAEITDINQRKIYLNFLEEKVLKSLQREYKLAESSSQEKKAISSENTKFDYELHMRILECLSMEVDKFGKHYESIKDKLLVCESCKEDDWISFNDFHEKKRGEKDFEEVLSLDSKVERLTKTLMLTGQYEIEENVLVYKENNIPWKNTEESKKSKTAKDLCKEMDKGECDIKMCSYFPAKGHETHLVRELRVANMLIDHNKYEEDGTESHPTLVLLETHQNRGAGWFRRFMAPSEKLHRGEGPSEGAARGITEEFDINYDQFKEVKALNNREPTLVEETRSPSYPGLVSRYFLYRRYFHSEVLNHEGFASREGALSHQWMWYTHENFVTMTTVRANYHGVMKFKPLTKEGQQDEDSKDTKDEGPRKTKDLSPDIALMDAVLRSHEVENDYAHAQSRCTMIANKIIQNARPPCPAQSCSDSCKKDCHCECQEAGPDDAKP